LKTDHNFGSSCRKFIPVSEAAWHYKTDFIGYVVRCSAASHLDNDQLDGEKGSQTYMPLFKEVGPWGPSSLLPHTLCSHLCLGRGHAKGRKSDFMAPSTLPGVIHNVKGNSNSRLFASTGQPVQVQGYRKETYPI